MAGSARDSEGFFSPSRVLIGGMLFYNRLETLVDGWKTVVSAGEWFVAGVAVS
jgi:hypothetical protein